MYGKYNKQEVLDVVVEAGAPTEATQTLWSACVYTKVMRMNTMHTYKSTRPPLEAASPLNSWC